MAWIESHQSLPRKGDGRADAGGGMNYLDACAGIGGFALGLEMAGLRFDWHGYSEIERACEENYARHWPEALRLGDLAQWVEWPRPPIDIFSAGFPCQPFSIAGRRKGAEDARNLWPLVARAIRGIRPRIVLLENVPALLCGDAQRPAYFGRVLSDLAEAGYDAEWQVLSAAEVGAPHRRERVFVVAHAKRSEWGPQAKSYGFARTGGKQGAHQKRQAAGRIGESGTSNEIGASHKRERVFIVAHDNCSRSAEQECEYQTLGWDEQPHQLHTGLGGPGGPRWNAAEYADRPLFPPGPADADGWRAVLARWPELAPATGGKLNVRFVEWLMGYPIGWTDGMKRKAALTALGNSVVPQCVATIVRRYLGSLL